MLGRSPQKGEPRAGRLFGKCPKYECDSMTESEAAELIQKHWRALAAARLADPELSRLIAATLGQPVEDYACFLKYLNNPGHVMVQLNGHRDRMQFGHSCFFFNNNIYHLSCCDAAMAAQSVSLGLARPTPIFRDDSKLWHPHLTNEDAGFYLFLRRQATQHLIKKKVIFLLKPGYARNFMRVYERTLTSFHGSHFPYGNHFNCHTIVASILKQMVRLTE